MQVDWIISKESDVIMLCNSGEDSQTLLCVHAFGNVCLWCVNHVIRCPDLPFQVVGAFMAFLEFIPRDIKKGL